MTMLELTFPVLICPGPDPEQRPGVAAHDRGALEELYRERVGAARVQGGALTGAQGQDQQDHYSRLRRRKSSSPLFHSVFG